MRLYDYGPSQNCFKVRLLAAHLGLSLEVGPVSIFQGEGALPGFLAKNPMGTVPLLETDAGEYLPESNAILTYLAEGTAYLPKNGMPRAQVMRWLMFEQRYIQTSISRLRYWTLTGKLDQFAQDVGTARSLGDRALDIANQELGRDSSWRATPTRSLTCLCLPTAMSSLTRALIFRDEGIFRRGLSGSSLSKGLMVQSFRIRATPIRPRNFPLPSDTGSLERMSAMIDAARGMVSEAWALARDGGCERDACRPPAHARRNERSTADHNRAW